MTDGYGGVGKTGLTLGCGGVTYEKAYYNTNSCAYSPNFWDSIVLHFF